MLEMIHTVRLKMLQLSHYSLMYVGSLSSSSVRVLTRVAKFGLSSALADQQDAITAHL